MGVLVDGRGGGGGGGGGRGVGRHVRGLVCTRQTHTSCEGRGKESGGM